ncbi:MAG: sigma-70 family RNA polymerase sigma factor [Myxococcota bacterium]
MDLDVARIHSVLIRYARRRLPEEPAQDAVQDTWEAYLSGRFEGRSRVETYLIAILRRRIADRYREQRRFAREVPQWSRDRIDERIDARSLLERIACEFERLPSRQQWALRAVVLEHQDRDQIAEDMGVSPNNLRVLLHRGRDRLRSCA